MPELQRAPAQPSANGAAAVTPTANHSEAVRRALESFTDPDQADAAQVAEAANQLLRGAGQAAGVTRDCVHQSRSWLRARVEGARLTPDNLRAISARLAAGEPVPRLRKKERTEVPRAHWCRLALLELDDPANASNARVAVLATTIARRHGLEVTVNKGDAQSAAQTMKLRMGEPITHDKIRRFCDENLVGKKAIEKLTRASAKPERKPLAERLSVSLEEMLELIGLARQFVLKAGSAAKAQKIIATMEAFFGGQTPA